MRVRSHILHLKVILEAYRSILKLRELTCKQDKKNYLHCQYIVNIRLTYFVSSILIILSQNFKLKHSLVCVNNIKGFILKNQIESA